MSNPQSPTYIYIMRHAQAADAQGGQRDIDRVLTPYGMSQARNLAATPQLINHPPSLILASPTKRVQQSCEIVSANFNCPVLTIDALYEADGLHYLQQLQQHQSMLAGQKPIMMIIGHNPSVWQLTKLLYDPQNNTLPMPQNFATSALAIFSSTPHSKQIKPKSFYLETYLQPQG